MITTWRKLVAVIGLLTVIAFGSFVWSQHRIAASNMQVEQLVQERTAALSEKVEELAGEIADTRQALLSVHAAAVALSAQVAELGAVPVVEVPPLPPPRFLAPQPTTTTSRPSPTTTAGSPSTTRRSVTTTTRDCQVELDPMFCVDLPSCCPLP